MVGPYEIIGIWIKALYKQGRRRRNAPLYCLSRDRKQEEILTHFNTVGGVDKVIDANEMNSLSRQNFR